MMAVPPCGEGRLAHAGAGWITATDSKSDGVVAWQTCRHGPFAGRVEDIEVASSHIGMGWNPAVLKVVADRLGHRLGQWRPYTNSQ